jgi:hypothetical protein
LDPTGRDPGNAVEDGAGGQLRDEAGGHFREVGSERTHAGPCPTAGRGPATHGGRAAARGRLLIEDFDVDLQPLACVDARREVEHRANRVRAGFLELLAQRGADLAYGRALPRRLRAAGLTDVAADAFAPVALPAAALEIANVRQVGAAPISQARASADEVDAHSVRSPPDSSISRPRPWAPHGAGDRDRDPREHAGTPASSATLRVDNPA